MSKTMKILPKNHYFRQNPSLAAPAAFLDRTSKCSKLPNLSKNEQKLENTIKKSQFLSKSRSRSACGFFGGLSWKSEKVARPDARKLRPERSGKTFRDNSEGPERTGKRSRRTSNAGKGPEKSFQKSGKDKKEEHLMCKFRVFRNKKRRTPVVCFCDCHVVKD